MAITAYPATKLGSSASAAASRTAIALYGTATYLFFLAVFVYTIGFGITTGTPASDLMRNCATDPDHAYLASTGDELRQAFREIATRIASLRLTH